MSEQGFKYIFLVGIIIVGAFRGAAKLAYRKETFSHTNKSMLELVAMSLWGWVELLAIIYVFVSWFDFADYAAPDVLSWIGISVYLLGIYVMWRSQADLGANWSPFVEIRSDQSLVTTGIYSKVRHPMYSGFFLFSLGQMLLLNNWIVGVSPMFFMAAIYFSRIDKEEALMLKTFGDRYQNYMEQTGRLFPKWSSKPT